MHHSDYCSRRRRVTQATLIAVLTVFSSITPLHAGNPTPSAHLEKPKMQSLGDLKNGEQQAGTCVACHGANGNSLVSAFPKIAGQSEKYIYKQLKNMKLKPDDPNARIVPQMTAILGGLTDEAMRDLATYFAAQTTTLEGANPELKALGEKIYRSGNKDTKVPACTACHGASGQGLKEAGIPALSGQHAAYTEAQLKAFRAAGREDLDATSYRTNDGDSMMMRKSAQALSDKEIRAVSSYVSGLH